MTPEDIAKIQARLDATNDARLSHLEWYNKVKILEVNARRDIHRLLDHVRELEFQVQELRDRAARTESPTAYAQIRPVNRTMDLPKMDTCDLGQPAGLRAQPPPIPRMDTKTRPEEALRAISQLLDQFKGER